jgi:3-hydroxyacyl-CoA dehydrogenase
VLARISPETDLSCAAQVDWVIEAVLEEEDSFGRVSLVSKEHRRVGSNARPDAR